MYIKNFSSQNRNNKPTNAAGTKANERIEVGRVSMNKHNAATGQSKTNKDFKHNLALIFMALSILVFLVALSPFGAKILVGSFGIIGYPLTILWFLISIAMYKNVRYKFKISLVINVALLILCFFAILQLAFTHKILELPFSDYVSKTYSSITPGGVFVGFFAWLAGFLLSTVGAYCFFVIALTLLIAYTVDYAYGVKQGKKIGINTSYYFKKQKEEDVIEFGEDGRVVVSRNEDENAPISKASYRNAKDVGWDADEASATELGEKLGIENEDSTKVNNEAVGWDAKVKESEEVMPDKKEILKEVLGINQKPDVRQPSREMEDFQRFMRSQREREQYLKNPDEDYGKIDYKNYNFYGGGKDGGVATNDTIISSDEIKKKNTESLYNNEINNPSGIITGRPAKVIVETQKADQGETVENIIHERRRRDSMLDEEPRVDPATGNKPLTTFYDPEIISESNRKPLESIRGFNVDANKQEDKKLKIESVAETVNFNESYLIEKPQDESKKPTEFEKLVEQEQRTEEEIDNVIDRLKTEDNNFIIETQPNIKEETDSKEETQNKIVPVDEEVENVADNIDFKADINALNQTQQYQSEEMKAFDEEQEQEIRAREQIIREKYGGIQRPAKEPDLLDLAQQKEEEEKSTVLKFYADNAQEYNRPPVELLNIIEKQTSDLETAEYYKERGERIEETLANFNVPVNVIGITIGPAVTRYEVQISPGVSVNKIQQYSNDLAYAMESNGGIRIEAPIPGKNAVGIEIPNKKITPVSIREVVDSDEFRVSKPLAFALGKDIAGQKIMCNIDDMPHLLVAGSTGSGKSVCLNTLLISLLYKMSPADLKIILIDPKRVEFSTYNKLPHLLMPEAIIEPKDAISALGWACGEMDRRFQLFHGVAVRDLGEYNKREEVRNGQEAKLPNILIIIDELADLMLLNKRDVEDKIKRLTALGRAAGLRLVVATQRPSVDVLTGTIKNNLPSRIAFAVTSMPDSKTILDQGGAENLLGRGDMLYSPREYAEPKRVQGAFITTEEVKAVVDYIKQNNDTYFDPNLEKIVLNKKDEKPLSEVTEVSEENKVKFDSLFVDALRFAIEVGQVSTSSLLRRFAIGYNRAGRIIDTMEQNKMISPNDGTNKPRKVYITEEEFKMLFGDKD